MTGDWQDEAMEHALRCDARDEIDDWLLPLPSEDVAADESDGAEDDGDMHIDLWTEVGQALNAWLGRFAGERKE